jgi:transposase
MRYWVGFDVGKSFHWVCVLDKEGKEVLSRKVEATEEDLEASCSEIEQLGGERTVGIDVLGGPATLLEAVLLGRGQRVFHVPGIAVNRARDAYPGEAKSDSKDAHVIADQLRLRSASLHEVCPRDETTAEMRVLVAHRRDLLQEQTRRAARPFNVIAVMTGEVVSLYQWGFLHDCELPAYSRGALCLPPERAIFKHLLDRQARS